MTLNVIVPASGESVTSANIATWHKQHGDMVAAGEVIVTLDTDKVSNDLEAEAAGVLEILAPVDTEVAIGAIIAKIHPSDPAANPSAPSSPATTMPASSPAPAVAAPAEVLVQAPVAPEATVLSSPAPIAAAPAVPVPSPAPVAVATTENDARTTRKKMSMLRRKIATQLVNAQRSAAILSTFNEVDLTAILELRKSLQEEFVKKHGVKLGLMSFFVKATVQALKDVPAINARIDGTDIIQNHFYDIGVAIGSDKGLVVPAIRDADQKSFAQIEQEILHFAQKAQQGQITLEDLQGAVFTISNGGTYGSLLSTPILNPPQSGILGMHTIQQRPIALDGQVVIRPMMYLALSYDHRLVDGKEAVTFLIRIKNLLESPTRLMLEI